MLNPQPPSRGSSEWEPIWQISLSRRIIKLWFHFKCFWVCYLFLRARIQICCYLFVSPKVLLQDILFFFVNQYAIVIMIGHLTQRQSLRGNGKQAAFHRGDLQPRMREHTIIATGYEWSHAPVWINFLLSSLTAAPAAVCMWTMHFTSGRTA